MLSDTQTEGLGGARLGKSTAEGRKTPSQTLLDLSELENRSVSDSRRLNVMHSWLEREGETHRERHCILKRDVPAYLRRMYGCGCLHEEIVRRRDNVQKEALGGGRVLQISYRLLRREK